MSSNSNNKPRDFEIPIQLHTRPPNGAIDPTHTQLDKPIVDKGQEFTSWSYGDPSATPSTSDVRPSIPADEAVQPPADIPQVPKKKNRRKFEAINPNDLPDGMFPGILKPNAIPSWRTVSFELVIDPATGKRVPYGTVWSHDITDNNRSRNPSDREVAQEKIKEKERARLKAEAVAAKKNKKAAPKRRGSNNVTASGSRNASPAPDIEMASPVVNTTVALAAPNGMKRTRSAGGGAGPISSALANSLGAGSVNVSSPLKAVTGPNTPEEVVAGRSVDPAPTGPRRGRSRLSGDSISPPNEAETARKANSHSPTTSTIPLAANPGPINATAGSSKALPRNGSIAATDMRRVVSASNIGKKAGAGSPLAFEARERSRREVILPGRLRDYDVKAGTPL